MVLTDNDIYLKVIWLGMENGVEVFVGQKDNYEVKGFFASGGMGDIFEALDSRGNEVLIKVPKKFSAGRNDPNTGLPIYMLQAQNIIRLNQVPKDLIKKGIPEKSKGSDGALYR